MKKRKTIKDVESYLEVGKKIQLSTNKLKRRVGIVEKVSDSYFEFKEIINIGEVISDKVSPEFNYHLVNKDEVEDISYFS